MFNTNCTIVTGLFDVDRHLWSNYVRSWEEYLRYFKNMLSLKCSMYIYVQEKTIDFVKQERLKIDPELKYTKIVQIEIPDLPAYKYFERIKEIMYDPNFRNGLVLPDVPEVCSPYYSVVIHSKVPIVCEVIKENLFKSNYFMWVDAGICHQHFPETLLNAYYPNDEKIKILDDNRIRLLCRSLPEQRDLNLEWFFKSHTNRFGAGCIPGTSEAFNWFDEKCTEVLERALNKNLIDCEQSVFAIVYLENKDKIEAYQADWYDNFLRFIQT
jgi:protein YibB